MSHPAHATARSIQRALASLAALVVCLAALPACPARAQDDASALPPVTSLALERRYDKLGERLDALDTEIETLREVSGIAADALEEIEQATPPSDTEIDAAVKELRLSIGAIQRLDPSQTLSAESRPIINLRNTMEKMMRLLEGLETTADRRLDAIVPYQPDGRFERELLSLMRSMTDGMAGGGWGETPQPALLPVWNLMQAIPFRGDVSRDVLSPLLAEAATTVDDAEFPKQVRAAFDATKAMRRAHFNELRTRLGREIAEREAERQQIATQLTEIENTTASKQSALDERLSWAIYLMIGTLLLMYGGLYFFPPDVSSALISRRTLVEVVSMAFMLLTIIILGTGGRIGKETLGTLLGTIAGYIFGRRLGETETRHDNGGGGGAGAPPAGAPQTP